MSVSHSSNSECQPLAVPPFPRKRRLRLNAALILVAGIAGAASLLLSWPVARISPETALLITPGMTAEQAERIVGAPPSWYDGVGGISTNEPPFKGSYWREWTGSRGCLILSPDRNGRVGSVTFYPAVWVERSAWQLLVERLTRSTEEQWHRWWIYGDRDKPRAATAPGPAGGV